MQTDFSICYVRYLFHGARTFFGPDREHIYIASHDTFSDLSILHCVLSRFAYTNKLVRVTYRRLTRHTLNHVGIAVAKM